MLSGTMSGGLGSPPSGGSSRWVVPGSGTSMLCKGKVIGSRIKSMSTSANLTIFPFLRGLLVFLTSGVYGAREGDFGGGGLPSKALTASPLGVTTSDSLLARATTRFCIRFEHLDAKGLATPNAIVG